MRQKSETQIVTKIIHYNCEKLKNLNCQKKLWGKLDTSTTKMYLRQLSAISQCFERKSAKNCQKLQQKVPKKCPKGQNNVKRSRFHSVSLTIRSHRESWCLPYAGFFLNDILAKNIVHTWRKGGCLRFTRYSHWHLNVLLTFAESFQLALFKFLKIASNCQCHP